MRPLHVILTRNAAPSSGRYVRDALYVSVGRSAAFRNGRVVAISPAARRLLLRATYRHGELIGRDEGIEALYFDADDGGSENASTVLNLARHELSYLCPALGLRMEIEGNRGFTIEDSAVPHTVEPQEGNE